jgi:hypothetical protein
MVTNIQIRNKLKFYTKPYGRQWKWRYQVHGRIIEPRLTLPKGLKRGVNIIDPLHSSARKLIPNGNDPKETWRPEVRHPILEHMFFPPQTIRNHPNYKRKPIKLLDKTTKFHAGIDQVGLLTKTVTIKGLSPNVNKVFESLKLGDEQVSSFVT